MDGLLDSRAEAAEKSISSPLLLVRTRLSMSERYTDPGCVGRIIISNTTTCPRTFLKILSPCATVSISRPLGWLKRTKITLFSVKYESRMRAVTDWPNLPVAWAPHVEDTVSRRTATPGDAARHRAAALVYRRRGYTRKRSFPRHHHPFHSSLRHSFENAKQERNQSPCSYITVLCFELS
jgi:hypothetical protein